MTSFRFGADETMVTTQVMPATSMIQLVTFDQAIMPYGEFEGFITDANGKFIIDNMGNKINSEAYRAGDSGFQNAVISPYITPSESSLPVSTTNLVENIQDMQLPPLNAAQNPIIPQTQDQPVKQNNSMMYMVGAFLLGYLLKR